MKYGIIYNKNNRNIGDDIQAYATAQFLPQVDYFIDREHIDEFQSQEHEPVAVIMNAWYMWAKWNWPPSRDIYPHMVGFHYADHQLAGQPGSPFKYEFLTGRGGDYLRAYGPVGCRDFFTRDRLQEIGIDAYFSGCITLTLPRQKETADKGSYLCIVDVEQRVKDKLLRLCEDQGIEVRVVKHDRERDPDMSWEERTRIVEEYLTLYQNARCVITRRLHCALPCLAMGVPVLVIKERRDDIRFEPYYEFFHHVTVTDFMKDHYVYDFVHPTPNKENYRLTRERMIASCRKFIDETRAVRGTAEELFKPDYTEAEVRAWRHDQMKVGMDEWYLKYRALQISEKKLRDGTKKLNKSIHRQLEEMELLRKTKEEELKTLQESKAEEIRVLQQEIERFRNRTFVEKLKSLFQKEQQGEKRRKCE